MGRTPISPGSIHRNYYVQQVNDDHLRAAMRAVERTFTEAVNYEIYFARTFGLPPNVAASLHAEAARQRVTAKDLVFQILHAELATWPAPKKPIHDPPQAMSNKSSCTITGSNDAYLLRICTEKNIEYSEAMDLVLNFNRTFDLRPNLLGALQEKAKTLGFLPRDIATTIIFTKAVLLPEAPAPNAKALRP